MIKNSETLYRRAKEFQNKRKSIVDHYEDRMKSLEDMRGSKYYTDEGKKANDEMKAELDKLINEYSAYFDVTLSAMNNANVKRGAIAPTDEELRLITALKMRDSISEEELIRVAQSLKGNPMCLAVVDEVAKKNHISGSFLKYAEAKEMPVDTVASAIEAIRDGLNDFMRYDTRRAARRVVELRKQQYGTEYDAPKRDLFDSEEGFYKEMWPGLEGHTLKLFTEAVDAE